MSTGVGTMVGREVELEMIVGLFERRDDLPAALLVEGQPGIGKTTLWEQGVAAATGSGYRVLACRPAGGETELSFAALSDLLEAEADGFLPRLPAPQRRALEVALLRRDEDGRPPDPRAIAAGVLGAVRVLARDGPLAIAIDDAQWLDAPSAAAIDYAVRRLTREPVAVLASSRSELTAIPPLDLERSLGRRLTRVQVGPMSLGALHNLLHERTGEAFNRPTLRRIHETSGGNPFYALELARAVQAGGAERAPGEPLALSSSLSELLAQRLAGFPDGTRDALFVAAAATRPTVGLIEAVVGAPTMPLLQPAVDAGIVRVEQGVLQFTHPLLAAAAYERVDDGGRRRWHAQLATATTDFEERARHLALATEGPDAAVAAMLEEAGHRARSRGAPATAAELLGHAIDRTPGDAAVERARRTVDAVPTLLLAGERQRARALLDAAVGTIGPGGLRADALLQLADIVADEPGGDVRAAALLQQSLSEAGSDPGRQARALLDLEMFERSADRLGDALTIARQALVLAEEARDDVLLAHALTRTADLEVVLGLGADPPVHFRRALEQAAVVRIEANAGPAAMLAVCLIRAGRLDEARPLLLEERRRTEDEGDETSRSQLCLFLAEVEWLAGHWAEARGYAAEGLELADRNAVHVFSGALLALRALVEAGFGEADLARSSANRGVAICDEIGEYAYGYYNRQVLGFLELSLGDAAGAHRHLAGYSVERGIEGTKRISFIGDEIEALVRLGELESAEALVIELARRAEVLHRPSLAAIAARSRGLVLAARGETASAVDAADQARVAFAGLGMPFEAARALLVLGEVHRRGKHKRAGRQALEAATAAFERVGAPLWADKARGELARIGGRSVEGGLTPTERRVAELVAAGRSNKEVAAELFVTVRAVEANLSRVYAKLGVRSRTELARQLKPE